MVHADDLDRTLGAIPLGVAGPEATCPGDGWRVDLRRVLTGLRYLEASAEPAHVFTGLAAVCVPALCDECLVQISEHGRPPYRIRRTWPVIASTSTHPSDRAFTVLIEGRGTVLDRD